MKYNKEANAQALRQSFDTQKPRATVRNICTGRANWNACDFIDHHLQEYTEAGPLCWKQSASHNCTHCMEATA